MIPTQRTGSEETFGVSTQQAALKAGHWLQHNQNSRGDWVGDVEWCTMLVSQVTIARFVLQKPLTDNQRLGFLRTLTTMQAPDGSFGLHPASSGYVFTTALAYVALRLLGADVQDPRATAARRWLMDRGGVLNIPTWGKIWLAFANLYRWDGINPMPVELWCLPESSPIHPSRYYCHTRLIYLPLGVLSALRFVGPPTGSHLPPVIEALRAELYGDTSFDRIDFAAYRHAVAPSDVFDSPSILLQLSYDLMVLYERRPAPVLRRYAIAKNLRRIRFELVSTQYRCISPVSGLLNALALAAAHPDDPDVDRALAGVDTWQRERFDGSIDVQGASSETWDTAFVIQAVTAAGPTVEWEQCLRRAADFLVSNQVSREFGNDKLTYRDTQRGGWCFGDSHHHWPVSDTTAEAVSALTVLRHTFLDIPNLTPENTEAAVRFLLSRQNEDGGFGSYEKRRGNLWLDKLNPSEMYGSCMTERSYVECTASCIKALSLLRPTLDADIGRTADRAIRAGGMFLRRVQHRDGYWPGFWGVFGIYGTLFAVKGLRASGALPDDAALRRARAWLLAQQRPDGGWGEHWRSCLIGKPILAPTSMVISTAWALLALMWAGESDDTALRAGIAWLVRAQNEDGSWPRQDPPGVFFGTAMLHYSLYKVTFPLWALNTWHKRTTKPRAGM